MPRQANQFEQIIQSVIAIDILNFVQNRRTTNESTHEEARLFGWSHLCRSRNENQTELSPFIAVYISYRAIVGKILRWAQATSASPRAESHRRKSKPQPCHMRGLELGCLGETTYIRLDSNGYKGIQP